MYLVTKKIQLQLVKTFTILNHCTKKPICNFFQDDPLLLSVNRWEHSFPNHFVPHSLAVGFQHPICDAYIRQRVSRFVFLAEFQGRCWELVCDDVILESHLWQSCQDTWLHERTLSIPEFKR